MPSPQSSRKPTAAFADTRPPTDGDPVIGPYRIEREIGRGAMGAVFLGRDARGGRAVAVKTLALSHEFHADKVDAARERFFHEAKTAGRLHHDDIVAVYEVGEDAGVAYIAMEYLQGQDLVPYTHPKRLLPVPLVLRIMVRVVKALAYAHSQGVVHRDIKPANVVVDLHTASVKVTDFGIASVGDGSRTRTGVVIGTPSFMSPEQLAGHAADGRSDLYAAGVMLFQLLTGRLPHQADSMAALMYRIANELAPDVRSLRPELPEALANVVMLALQKRPEMRYANGNQMAVDLVAVDGLMTLMANAAAAAADAAGAASPASPDAVSTSSSDEKFDSSPPPLPF
ncbi:MAG: serine/threonine protein kinase PrkC, regulator of stationary phase [Rhizobacter sp.]|nr:serine/threonine protein kinase PrkC, regulator of stationary phase [Rhizobacter sp.]